MSEQDADTETSVSLKDELSKAFDGGAETPAPETATPEPAPVTAEPALEIPKHWSDVDKQLFPKATRDLQKRWLERETEYSRGIDEKAQALARLKRDYDPLDAMLKPYDQELGLRGANRQQLIQSWASTYKGLAEKPVETLQWLARQYGVDPSTLLQEAPTIDPAVQPFMQKVTSVEAKLNAMEQSARQAEMAGNLSRVQAFADAKDDAGQPLHPFFDDVAEDTVKLLRAGERDLQAAYNKAVRMNDTVFEKMQAAKVQAEAAKKDVEAKAKVDKAKRAAVGTSSEANGATKPKSLRDDLEAGLAGWGQ